MGIRALEPQREELDQDAKEASEQREAQEARCREGSCQHDSEVGVENTSVQYVLSICGAYFSDVMVSPGFRSCSGSDQQQTTKQ